jgi:hypothetical protein
MKISLRKADAIQRAVNDAINALPLVTEVSINEFERPTDKISLAKSKFSAALATRDQLLNVLYDIRVAVGSQNEAHGISARLAAVARLEKEIVLMKRISGITPAVSHDVLIGKIGKIKGREADAYSRFDEEIRTSIFDEAELSDIKNRLAELKLRKQAIQDELLELNVRVQIELSDDAVAVLQEASVL